MPRVLVLYSLDAPPGAQGGAPDRAEPAVVARAVAAALAAAGHEAPVVGVWTPEQIAHALELHRPNAVFNLIEDLGGSSSGEIEAAIAIERSGVPYTGSAPEVLRLCLNKLLSTRTLADAKVPVPRTGFVDDPETIPFGVSLPAILKPACEDASVGIATSNVVCDRLAFTARAAEMRREFAAGVIAQEMLSGREVNVSMLEDAGAPDGVRVLSPAEIVYDELPPSHPPILTYASKWDPADLGYQRIPVVAARLEPEARARVESVARRAFRALGMRDYGRVDLRFAGGATGAPRVLDANPNCCLASDAGFANAMRREGSTPEALWVSLAERALARGGRSRTA